ncbi:MAG: ammonium transporter [Actinomycetota bacterium]
MAEQFNLERRSRRLRQSATFVLLGVVVAVFALALGQSGDRLPTSSVADPIDEMWVLIAASLVFFMQAGFLLFEVGLAREVHAPAVAMKNLVDWVVGSLAFFFIGFGLMFGDGTPMIGSVTWDLDELFAATSTVSGPTFFLFQLAFAGTAITIISGSLVERMTFLAYVSFSAVVGLLIYPVYGHWVWGGTFTDEAFSGGTIGWLAEQGFHDFAGGTVVHLTGATAALIGVIMVGPRIGRFRPNGAVRIFPPSSIPMTAVGTLILWFGWFGFNGGSTLAFTQDVPRIILVTNLSGVAGLAAASLYAYLIEDRMDMVSKMIGGGLSGLVAITAGADVIGPLGAIVTGLVAGVLYNVGYELLIRMRIDDALGVVPAHGLAGIWGTLAVALFAPGSVLGRPRVEQLTIQTFGVVVNIVWVVVTSVIAFSIIKRIVGLRVSPMREQRGVDLELDDLPSPTIETMEELADDELESLLD